MEWCLAIIFLELKKHTQKYAQTLNGIASASKPKGLVQFDLDQKPERSLNMVNPKYMNQNSDPTIYNAQ